MAGELRALERQAEEVSPWCERNLHVRDTVTGRCRECGDVKDPAAEHYELLTHEPPPASIVLASGPSGTAWQRHARDGMWHSSTGKRAFWPTLLKSDRPGSRTRLVYLPPFETFVPTSD